MSDDRSTLSRRTLAKGTAWAVPAVAVASSAPAIAASPCTAARCSTTQLQSALTFGSGLNANQWTTSYQSYVGAANPVSGRLYGTAPKFVVAGSDQMCLNSSSTTPVNSDDGEGGTPYGGLAWYNGWLPQTANGGTAMGCSPIDGFDYTTTGNIGVTGPAIVANGDVIAPVSTTTDSSGNNTTAAYAATIAYTSACVCLGAGTYNIRVPWAIWNGGYRSITVWMIATDCATGVKKSLFAENPTAAPLGWGKGVVQPVGNTYRSRCDRGFQGPPDARTIANASGTTTATLTLGAASRYKFSFVFAYGPNQLCYCGCRSRSNQAAIGQPTITCA